MGTLDDQVTRTQNARILSFLQDGNDITSLEALEQFGCFRLASRISDLRKRGIPIQSAFVETRTGKKIKRYWLSPDQISA